MSAIDEFMNVDQSELPDINALLEETRLPAGVCICIMDTPMQNREREEVLEIFTMAAIHYRKWRPLSWKEFDRLYALYKHPDSLEIIATLYQLESAGLVTKVHGIEENGAVIIPSARLINMLNQAKINF
ncbi:MAG TPA: hypothetical protein VK338_04035 [Candidatus Nitrosocosmicus sp.]|nr:hypothetical protein [Candidatus Nitrosocosmicus sp.]